ncbi:MAG: cytoplasmic protein [Methylocystis sp.]
MRGVDVVGAHSHSSRHSEELRGSKTCGCFYCLAVFPPTEIADWIDDYDTALCPRCGVDSVVGDGSGFPVTDGGFLAAMKGHWFDRTVTIRSAK